MGGICVDGGQALRNEEIRNIQINRLFNAEREHRQIALLLGFDSAHFSIYRALRALYSPDFSPPECIQELENARQFAVAEMQKLLSITDALHIHLDDTDSIRASSFIRPIPLDCLDLWSGETTDSIRILWDDPLLQRAFARRSEVPQTAMSPLAEQLFSDLKQLTIRDEEAKDEDPLKFIRFASRQHVTSGVCEFSYPETCTCLTEPQVEMRKVTPHFLDDRCYLYFVVDVSAFDSFLPTPKNAYHIDPADSPFSRSIFLSLDMFEKLCNDPTMRRKSMNLILYEFDLFKERIERDRGECLSAIFPEYHGEGDANQAFIFLRDLFRQKYAIQMGSFVVSMASSSDPQSIAQAFSRVFPYPPRRGPAHDHGFPAQAPALPMLNDNFEDML